MGKRIVLIHGRSYKPDKTSLKNNWVEAIRHGIERDHGTAKATAFKKTRLEMAYYGDLSNQFLSISGKGSWTPSREAKDEADRKEEAERTRPTNSWKCARHWSKASSAIGSSPGKAS